MRHLKNFAKIIILVLTLVYISSFFTIRYYKEHKQDINNEAVAFKKSKAWIIQEHIKIVLGCLFFVKLNAAFWFISIILFL